MREPMRTIPASLESEAGLLGALMLDNEAIHRVRGLDGDVFHNAFHGQVWRAITSLATAGQPFDMVSVYTEMQAQGLEPNMVALNDIAQYVPSGANIRRFAEIVADRYRSRQLMNAGSAIADIAMTPGGSAAEQIDKAQMLLAKLATVRAKRDPQFITESLDSYLGLLQDLSEGKNPAMRTGIEGLDRILNGGGRRGEVLVIGARPKHGKTALSLALARNMARDYSVLFLSQEMPISQLMHRHTAASGSFDLARILAADADDSEMWSAVSEAARRLGELHLNHDDQTSLSLMDIRRKALKVKRERGLDVLFVDFLQLMAGAGEESRNRELDVIVNGLKGLAMDMQIYVVILSQMSREADKHYGPPAMTHLRDSGAIEAAADQIALLFTDWAHPMSKRTSEFQGYSQLDIVAHRNGPQGLVPLKFVGRFQQMDDWFGEIPRHTLPAAAPRARGFTN